MPELPEVETVKRTLNELVIGKTVARVAVRWPNIVRRPRDPVCFGRLLTGETIHRIRRRGKFLLFCFDSKVMVSHLRMEGRYRFGDGQEPVDKHTHVIFYFADGTALFYRDVRKFGTMHIFDAGEEWSLPPLDHLGPEPLSEAFTVSALARSCRKTTRAVKPLLLDQSAVAGLGNIYTDEVLFRAHIHPLRRAAGLSDAEMAGLHRAIIETLREAVRLGGSSVRTFVNGQGQMGLFQRELAVYGRAGLPCRRCGTPIRKIKVGGRGTHYCPACQRGEQTR